jgi:glycosyltransferase involved in cell wall biosynthesis
MNILYLISASDNPLYRGRYQLHERYQTYGQHSFIYDFVVAASRRGIKIDLLVEGLHLFPLAQPLTSYCNMFDLADAPEPGPIDLALVDEIPDRLMDWLPDGVLAFGIIHNAGSIFSAERQARCSRFICMTEAALDRQMKSIPAEKLALIHQGVNTERFKPQPKNEAKAASLQPRVLIYSRMDDGKQEVITRIVSLLMETEFQLTVLGDGASFWSMSDQFGARLTLINHIPCHSIHNFLGNFDAVVSSGRGAMEALASGLPTLCAGFDYAGPITPDNIAHLLRTNLTGYGAPSDIANAASDMRIALDVDRGIYRRMAEDYCSVDRFLDQLVATYTSLRGNRLSASPQGNLTA